ncbi:MAG: hypothetical protein LBR15_00925 [Methanobrevibacter sp.]|jgi:hypothetical protein|nr:hypothetical protein [Candidatus Methanovirga australis]
MNLLKPISTFFKDIFTACECINNENHRVLEQTTIPEDFPDLDSIDRYEESVVLEELEQDYQDATEPKKSYKNLKDGLI